MTKYKIININRTTGIIIVGQRLERKEDRNDFVAINSVLQDMKNILKAYSRKRLERQNERSHDRYRNQN